MSPRLSRRCKRTLILTLTVVLAIYLIYFYSRSPQHFGFHSSNGNEFLKYFNFNLDPEDRLLIRRQFTPLSQDPLEGNELFHQPTEEDVRQRFTGRRQTLHNACQTLNESHSKARQHAPRFVFPTNTTPTAIYCPIPKTGTTFLKQLFAAHNNKHFVAWNENFNVRPVQDFQEAIMFLFARDPYSRILSAYVDKLWVPNVYFWERLGLEIIHTVRPNTTDGSRLCGHDVTFPETIDYIIQRHRQKKAVNSHLTPLYEYCQVCDYNYDYIGHMETFRDDLDFILKAINVTSKTGLDNSNITIANTVDRIIDAIHRNKCAVTWDEQFRRAWRALQIRGIISMTLNYPFRRAVDLTPGLQKRSVLSDTLYTAATKTDVIFQTADELVDSRTGRRQKDLVLGARQIQKRMALASAYSLISMETKLELMKIFAKDFTLFSYDPKPEIIFSQKVSGEISIFDIKTV